jgi:hypothetical protein
MPLNSRNPGALPNVFARCEDARTLLAKAKLDADLKALVGSVLAFAQTQHELNKRLWEAKKGLPEPHSETHLGSAGATDDSLSGNQLPESIDVGDAGEIGHAILGFAPIDHQHEAAGLDELLAFAFLGYR